jgi:hypothetical protein
VDAQRPVLRVKEHEKRVRESKAKTDWSKIEICRISVYVKI